MGNQLQLLSESPGYLEKLRAVSEQARVKGARIHDARIAGALSPSWCQWVVVSRPRFFSFSSTESPQPLCGKVNDTGSCREKLWRLQDGSLNVLDRFFEGRRLHRH